MTLEDRVHGEVEFEFREDDQGKGEFLACGKVISTLRSFLAGGQLDQAARLLAACAENVGDELMQDAIAGGASVQVISGLAKMFFQAKDYGRAAVCAERMGDLEFTARCYEANYDFARAAECYEAANQLSKAAGLFERNLHFDRAAVLYLRLGDLARAAENLERLQRYYQAGELYVRMKRWDKAVDVLQRMDKEDPHFVHGVYLLGQILERTGNARSAMQWYAEVVRSRPLDKISSTIHYHLAKLSAEQELQEQATGLLAGILRFNPEHAEARALLTELSAKRGGAAAVPDIQVDLDDGGAVSALPPLPPLPPGAGEASPTTQREERLVGVDRDFEFLHQAPLFAELSLDELKYVHSMCDKTVCAQGKPLIREGQPGEALFVIVRGKVGISSTGPGGQVVKLGEVGPGAHLGEMALLDDAPTSATVAALEEVVAFRLARQRFEELIQANERIQLRIYTVMVGTLVKRLREANTKLAAAGR